MAEIAENMQEGLLALAVGAGLRVMQTLMGADAGAMGKHDANRSAVRHGGERGSVTLGGRRVPLTRPRVRAADGSGELPVASDELFSSTEILGRLALEKMLAGLSTRRYPVGLEPGPVSQLVERSSARCKSAVSRRFVVMTETALAELLSADLSGLDLIALMIDGVHLAKSCCVVALGIDIEGNKHPLVPVEAQAAPLTLAKELDRTHPAAAASLREGLEETLTVLRLGVPPTLARLLRSTNPIESMISVCRDHASNVTRWRNGQTALRWCGGDGRGRQAVPPRQRSPAPTSIAGRARSRVRRTCRTDRAQRPHERSPTLTGPPPKFHGTRDILHRLPAQPPGRDHGG